MKLPLTLHSMNLLSSTSKNKTKETIKKNNSGRKSSHKLLILTAFSVLDTNTKTDCKYSDHVSSKRPHNG